MHQDAARHIAHVGIGKLVELAIEDDDVREHCDVANTIDEIAGDIRPVPGDILMREARFEGGLVLAFAFALVGEQHRFGNAWRVDIAYHCRK